MLSFKVVSTTVCLILTSTSLVYAGANSTPGFAEGEGTSSVGIDSLVPNSVETGSSQSVTASDGNGGTVTVAIDAAKGMLSITRNPADGSSGQVIVLDFNGPTTVITNPGGAPLSASQVSKLNALLAAIPGVNPATRSALSAVIARSSS
jgi:hypothetical protein